MIRGGVSLRSTDYTITDLDIFDDISTHGQLIIAEEVNMYKTCAISKSSQIFFTRIVNV